MNKKTIGLLLITPIFILTGCLLYILGLKNALIFLGVLFISVIGNIGLALLLDKHDK